MLVPVEMVPQSLRVIACPRPFSMDRVDLRLPAGGSVAELMQAAGIEPDRVYARVFLDDQLVEQAYWEHVRPKPGHTLTVRVIPTGGGGGGGKDPLRIVLQIVVIAVAAWATAGIAGGLIAAGWGAGAAWAVGAAAGAAISIVGNLVVNALVPPPIPNAALTNGASGAGATQDGSVYSITGSQNRLLPYGVIPRVLGRHKLYPPLAAKPYTELVGDDLYYRLCFTCGYGPLALSDYKIGTTSVSTFTNVETETRQGYPGDAPLTLFSNAILEDALSIALTAAGGWQQRTSRSQARELSVDITCPQGLTKYTNDGAKTPWTIQVDVEYAPAGSGSWTAAGSLILTEARASQVRRGLRWTVATEGVYDIRLRRTTADSTDTLIRDQVYWTALRTILRTQPVLKTGQALVAMRIKATDQLNGVVDQFNCVAHSILPDWNGSAWVAQTTNNPASLYRAVLQGTANARAVADSRLDLTTLQTWHQECAAAGRTFSAVIEARTTVFELLRLILARGRASFGMRDGKYSAVRDLVQSSPVQIFTPRNSWGFQGSKIFLDRPHALKMQFINPDADWQQDERIVYADGYSAANATKFETMSLIPGCTSSDEAWKDGRYHQAVAELRPETYVFWTDIENLVCTRGDRVQVSHDVPLFGLGSGRVKAVQTDGGGNATGLTLDEAIPMEAGTSYSVRIRKSTGAQVVQQITTVAGSQTTVTFTTPLAPASSPAIGDLVAFGVLGSETVDGMIKSIEPGPDFTAKLTLIDYAPAIQQAETGTIPAYTSQITSPTKFQNQQPPRPIIDAVRSDEEVLVRGQDGGWQSRILISFHFASGAPLAAVGVQVRYRRSGSGAPWSQLAVPLAGDTLEVGVMSVDDGVTYDLMLRSVSALGQTSDWATVSHTVVGKTSKPPDVTTLVLEGRWLRWLYPSPPKDQAGFRVRMQAGDNHNWASAIALHDGLLTETRFLVPLQDGIRTYLVKAVDTVGNESAGSALVNHDFGVLSLETEFGDQIPTNLILSTDVRAAGFPGSITNGSIIGGDLKAADNGALFWSGNDAAPFWSADETTLFWSVLYKEMTYVLDVTPDADKLDALFSLNLTIAAKSSTVEYRPDCQAFFWINNNNPFWSGSAALFWNQSLPDYLPCPSVLQGLTRQKYQIRITTAAGPVQGVISGLSLLWDVLDLVESFANLAIAAAGTRLPITKTYRAITQVHLTLLDDLGVAERVKVMDTNATLGPLVKAWDGANVLTTARVYATLKGY